MNVNPYKMKVVNPLLPAHEVGFLRWIKANYKIPYSEIFRRMVVSLKESNLGHHFKEIGDNSLGLKGYLVKEKLREKVKEVIPRMQRTGERIRISVILEQNSKTEDFKWYFVILSLLSDTLKGVAS
jgi:hypothetical protein